MSVYKITFSPTGGTKKAADIFTESFSPESTYVDLVSQKRIVPGILFGRRISVLYPFRPTAGGFRILP